MEKVMDRQLQSVALDEESIRKLATMVADILQARSDNRMVKSVTQTEAARRLGVDRSTVYRYLKSGKLQAGGKGVLVSSMSTSPMSPMPVGKYR
jgi:excisionase family DNA binding protein